MRGSLGVAAAFGHSLGIRHLVCGSCNGCEHEMNALGGPDYDISQEGWDIVASPRHADVVTVTGPMTDAMRLPAARTIEAVPEPKIIVAIGDCAIGRGVFSGSQSVGLGAGIELGAAVRVPGCPPTPAAIMDGLRRAAQALDGRDDSAPLDELADARLTTLTTGELTSNAQFGNRQRT